MCDGHQIKEEDIFFTTLSASNEISVDDEKTMKEYIANIITHFLKKYDKDVIKVAEKLDIGKSTIYKMIQNKEISIN
jgi:two-component system, NtrC family, response regulator AtoC